MKSIRTVCVIVFFTCRCDYRTGSFNFADDRHPYTFFDTVDFCIVTGARRDDGFGASLRCHDGLITNTFWSLSAFNRPPCRAVDEVHGGGWNLAGEQAFACFEATCQQEPKQPLGLHLYCNQTSFCNLNGPPAIARRGFSDGLPGGTEAVPASIDHSHKWLAI